MNEIKKEKKSLTLVRTALLFSIALVIQMIRMPPFITGPLMNYILILTTALLGLKSGITIGLLTPLGALLFGIIPPVLAPAIPFIMIGNAIYCLSFSLLSSFSHSYVGLFLGSLFKYAIIAGSANLLLSLPQSVVLALGAPQLFTALVGGVGALLTRNYFLPLLENRWKRE